MNGERASKTMTKSEPQSLTATIRKRFIERVNDGQVFGFETDLAKAYVEMVKRHDEAPWRDEEMELADYYETAKSLYRDWFVEIEDWLQAVYVLKGRYLRIQHPRYVTLLYLLINNIENYCK